MRNSIRNKEIREAKEERSNWKACEMLWVRFVTETKGHKKERDNKKEVFLTETRRENLDNF